jgi:hypothetical protein
MNSSCDCGILIKNRASLILYPAIAGYTYKFGCYAQQILQSQEFSKENKKSVYCLNEKRE